jgi:hypothetical protein
MASPAASVTAPQLATTDVQSAYNRYIASLSSGSHDENGLAIVLQAERPFMQLVKRFGPFKSMTFKGVSQEGWDVYEVAFESARAEWRIAPGARPDSK